jgi:hypothetical protein
VAATDPQVQRFVDERIRPHAEAARALVLAFDDDRASIDDVYAALNVPTPTWSDKRPDGPPRLLTPADVLAINGFMEDVRTFMKAHGQYAVVLKACVRPVG